MEGAKRIQLNVAVEPIKNIPMTKHITPHLYPVIWLDQAAAINDAGMSKFKNSFWYIQTAFHIGAYSLIAVGGLLIIVGVVCGIIRCRLVSRKKKEAKSMLKTETSPLLTDDNANLSIEGGTLNPHTRA